MMARDKLYHFAAGFVIAAITYAITGSIGFAAAAVMLAGAAKEAHDSFYPDRHTSDLLDIAATCAGWIPVAAATLIQAAP